MEYKLNLGKPSPKQQRFLTDTHRHVMFGGARGGGKSWSVRFKATVMALTYPGIKQCIIRKTYPELYANHILPFKEMLGIGKDGCPAKYNDSKKVITFDNGSMIFFEYCNSDKSLDNFQGKEYSIVYFDEACLLKEEWLTKINACVRGVGSFPKRSYYTLNPGGVSHAYFRRFVEGKYRDNENPDDYSFIQSLVTDNVALMKANPEYLDTLQRLPDKLRLAWLEGRWDVFEGAFFEEFRETPDAFKCEELGVPLEIARKEGIYTHVIEPFDVSKLDNRWKWLRSYDWGYGKPFSMNWYVLSPDGVLYMILECYGVTKTPNEGVKWTNKQQFTEFARIEREHPWLKGRRIEGVADPSIWDGSHDTYGISAAEEASKHGIYFERGNNERISGWMAVRERLKFDENGRAMLYFFDNCKDTIRTMPLQMYDEHKIEDCDTSLEDHAMDSLRYECMQHLLPPRVVEPEYIPMVDPLNQYKRTKRR